MAAVTIEVHPLVTLNLSDHFTRARYQQDKKSQIRVVGALLGRQEGRVIDIVNTVEFSYLPVSDEEGRI
jgi:COP9 signalosome complex subunit 6